MADRNLKRRRRAIILLTFLLSFLLYAIAVQKTDVNLAEVKSETRRVSLVRILRALAHPNLITYDSQEVTLSADILVPCPAGATPPEAKKSGTAYVEVTPSCANPGDTVTITGQGAEIGSSGFTFFVPESDYDVVLPLEPFQVDPDGNFAVTAKLPERESGNLQQIQAVTHVRVGSWLHRQEVWTDRNDNGIEDPEKMPDDGRLTVLIPAIAERPGVGIALQVDQAVVATAATGDDFVATSGPANGLAMSTGKLPGSKFAIEGIDNGELTVTGPPGSNLTDVVVLIYEPTNGTRSDTIELVDSYALSPRMSQNASDTLDKIIETVFMAFLATTIGTFLALPLSFMAARNLMRDIRTSVTNLSLNLIAIPIGGIVGLWVSRGARALAAQVGNDWLNLFISILIPIALVVTLRAILKEEDQEAPSSRERLVQTSVAIIAGFAVAIWVYVTGALLQNVGRAIEPGMGLFGFIGNFIAILGDVGALILPAVAILGAIGLMMNLGSKLGFAITDHLSRSVVRSINLPLAATAGGTIGVLIGAVVNWFYEYENLWTSRWIPLIVGAVIGLYLAIRRNDSEGVGVGMVVYYMARTLFNSLRSIEPLVMVIVFVVWIGFGPFAGSLALSLHTSAALAKLYSEQVESISTGPIEAVRATGATRLQTIVYGVVPQIVPPYMSFTMYRWDINVRMSTIIGFAGGGGIGFLLQQNINLLEYQDAAAQMLAIAIVVAAMDWISARLRERLV